MLPYPNLITDAKNSIFTLFSMANHWTQYTIEDLRSHATVVFRRGGGSRPDVLLIEINGERAVLKDQSGADRWFAFLVGPLLNWRETSALAKLASCRCIPDLLAKPNRRAFLMSYHPSKQITKLGEQPIDWQRFFTQLDESVAQMHALGVAHNDLRNPTNTLVTPSGEPVLVDLVAYFTRGPAWNLPQRWLFNKFCQVDKSALTKLKLRFAPHLVTEHDIHPEEIAGKAGLAAKQFGQWVRKISKALLTKN